MVSNTALKPEPGRFQVSRGGGGGWVQVNELCYKPMFTDMMDKDRARCHMPNGIATGFPK